MKELHQKYNEIIIQINDALKVSPFKQKSKLLAVSKTFDIEKISRLYSLGQRDFGESYIQELVDKVDKLSHLDIIWHFIGNLQTNKIKLMANVVSWIHSIEKESQIISLSKYRTITQSLNCLIQINLTNSANQHGLNINNVAEIISLANDINSKSNLHFRGLMGIATDTCDIHTINSEFKQLHELFLTLKTNYYKDIDTLSMGMSNDFIQAIQNGSTLVRVGSKIFGSRIYS